MSIVASCLVDTNIVSFMFKDHARLALYESFVAEGNPAVASTTLAEIYAGIERAQWGERRRREMDALLDRFIVLPPDRSVCRYYGIVIARGRAAGRPLSDADAWIAATAIAFELPLVTDNRRHFEGVAGLRLLGP